MKHIKLFENFEINGIGEDFTNLLSTSVLYDIVVKNLDSFFDNKYIGMTKYYIENELNTNNVLKVEYIENLLKRKLNQPEKENLIRRFRTNVINNINYDENFVATGRRI